MLFDRDITNLRDWGEVFQDISAFEPMAKQIFKKHGLEYSGLENCTPGSNAVFRSGKYIVKIFAPEESEIGGESDFLTEAFGIKRANRLGVSAPRLAADGVIRDKYIFRYLVMDRIEGRSLSDISDGLSGDERADAARELRRFVDIMDAPCERFNSHVLFGDAAEKRWTAFPPDFLRGRSEYLRAGRETVYVHGDLNPDNVIIDAAGRVFVIDFADALLAPVELELAGMICDGFGFDRDYMRGFLGEYDRAELLERLVFGLLIHDYGVNIVRDNIGDPGEIHSVDELRDRIAEKLV